MARLREVHAIEIEADAPLLEPVEVAGQEAPSDLAPKTVVVRPEVAEEPPHSPTSSPAEEVGELAGLGSTATGVLFGARDDRVRVR